MVVAVAYLQVLQPFFDRAGRGSAGDGSEVGADVAAGGGSCASDCDMYTNETREAETLEEMKCNDWGRIGALALK